MAWLPDRCGGLIPAHLSSLAPRELPRLGLLLEEKGQHGGQEGPGSLRTISPTPQPGWPHPRPGLGWLRC